MANYVYMIARMPHVISLPSLAVAGKPGKRRSMPAYKPQAVSDRLNPYSYQPLVALQI